ncbi:MAG: hypothetical protein EZS28_040865, partial [Streblomastix strix]
MSNEWNTTYLSPQRQGGHYLRPRKRKSEEEILNDILERYKTNKQSDVEQSRQLQVLVIQEILRKNQNFDLEEFIEALDLHENDAELAVLQEYANIIKVGGKSIIQWFNDYVYEMANRGQKRKNIRQELNVGEQQLRQSVEFPFKSKIKAYQKIHGIDFDQNEFKTDDTVDTLQSAHFVSIPDYQVKQLCKKFGRPYFSQNTERTDNNYGSWYYETIRPLISDAVGKQLFNQVVQIVLKSMGHTVDENHGRTIQALRRKQQLTFLRLAPYLWKKQFIGCLFQGKDLNEITVLYDQIKDLIAKTDTLIEKDNRGRKRKYSSEEEAKTIARKQIK